MIQESEKTYQSQIKVLQQENRILQDRLTKIEHYLEQISKEKTQPVSTQKVTIEKAILQQNQPNPFDGSTMIAYKIPESVEAAHLQITAASGKVLKTIPISSKGKGQTILEANALPEGTYFYSLVLDGVVQETKQMVLIK
jgi:flagellar hook assembly protein FlgD